MKRDMSSLHGLFFVVPTLALVAIAITVVAFVVEGSISGVDAILAATTIILAWATVLLAYFTKHLSLASKPLIELQKRNSEIGELRSKVDAAQKVMNIDGRITTADMSEGRTPAAGTSELQELSTRLDSALDDKLMPRVTELVNILSAVNSGTGDFRTASARFDVLFSELQRELREQVPRWRQRLSDLYSGN
jgi:hypothetical protein